jgi:hypothetical protein
MPSTVYASAQARTPNALAADRDHGARAWAHMATPMVVTPPCAVCGTPSARVELVAPGHVPAGWEQWPGTVRDSIVRRRAPGQWYLLFKGVATYNGYGDPIDAGRAGHRPGVPASPVLRSGPHGRVLRRCRFLPGLRCALLLSPLAGVRERLRLLPPRPR